MLARMRFKRARIMASKEAMAIRRDVPRSAVLCTWLDAHAVQIVAKLIAGNKQRGGVQKLGIEH